MGTRERSIDALIAEHLLGWRWMTTNGVSLLVDPADRATFGPEWRVGSPGQYTDLNLVPDLSTSGAGMLMVVEAMLSREPDWGFIVQRVSRGPWYASVSLPNWLSSSPDPMAKSDTAPMAVALAALKALKIEVPA